MTLGEVVGVLRGSMVGGGAPPGIAIESVCASDLMSDVLAFSRPRSLLITALVNPQVVRTAEMAEVAAICFVRGKEPPEETIALANESAIPLVSTRYSTYLCCGVLYAAGLVACDGSI
jgi:predicted transcriptional regulator